MQIQVTQPAGEAGLITVVDGLLDAEYCSRFIERLATVWDRSHQGKTLSGVNWATKTTEDIHVSEYAFRELGIEYDYKWHDLEMHFANGLISAVSMYKQQYRHLDTWTDIGDTGFQVQKYHRNFGYYRPHVDSFPSHNSSVANRVLASVMYLNDVEHGGETNFPLHGVKVTPRAGRIVLFPAVWTHPHESCVPISGDKWIISTFIVNDYYDENGQAVDQSQHQEVHSNDEHFHPSPGHDHDHPIVLSNQNELLQREHYHKCVQCANNEAHECTVL